MCVNLRAPVVIVKISTPLRTQTQLDTVNIYTANMGNKKQEPTDIKLLKLRILTNIFLKNFKIKKNEIYMLIIKPTRCTNFSNLFLE